ncbi:terminase large subunit [Clostridium frigidicarnis]|uniref:Phage terminase-like protein, large subunit, contains N-terminal HTH domain n=1 Tax=Clostridium frigidicarnis TaxID=84698 RepID=A0A1I0V228_9CLOT|nr:terminase TerL endonuclease subunit [Clostridium frigidicarnis]SFA70302.1 Phage terminase-like protein, large subunit, contains N-terminal HTH domain [Clostridium frigidicarnis]
MDRVTQYCYDVLDNKIIAGESIKLACCRHLEDLEKSKLAPYRYKFDIDKAHHIIDFAETLTLIEGSEGAKSLVLYSFQCFILGSLMGWVDKETGYRRFRQSYIQMGRQNGKSLLSGVLTTYHGNFINYNYGLILLGATKSDQAKIVYKEAVKFIDSDEDLKELFEVKEYKSEIECNLTNNLIRAVGRDTKSLDGFRAIYGSVDEFHAHKDNQMYSLIKDGQKKLKEALLNVITTAGFNLEGPCHKLYRYCKEVLEGKEKNETQFIFIAELDKDDDLEDSYNYFKANPTLQYDEFAQETIKTDYAQAKKMGGTDWNNFLTKQLDMWVAFTETKYMNMDSWYKCATNKTLEDFRSQECNIGMDLSSGGDLTSICFEFVWFEDDERKYFVHQHSFMPVNRVKEHEQTDNAPYKLWIKKGLLTVTHAGGGVKTDYKEVIKYIKEQIRLYDLKIKCIYYDQANASAFLADLESEGWDTLDVYQNSKSLNDSVMDIKYSVEAGNVEYNKKDELLTWAINNCELTKPYQGKVMLDKNSRFKRIDPIACWVDSHKFTMRVEDGCYNPIDALLKASEDW